MIELTEQQSEAIAAATEAPLTVVDGRTNTTYVLLQQHFYERICGLIDDDSARQMEPLLANTDPEDWEDAAAYEGKLFTVDERLIHKRSARCHHRSCNKSMLV